MNSRFVVHEHKATNLHYDFRLEIDGVLRSWAIPKGPSMNPTENRLSLMVEDHPIEYIDFEGIIPKGRYGAGAVVVWDKGSFNLIEHGENKITFFLSGKKLRGNFTLVRIKGKATQWLLIKQMDEFANNGWKLETVLTPKKRESLKTLIPPCEAS